MNRDSIESCCLLQRLNVSVGTLLMRVPQYTIWWFFFEVESESARWD